MLSFHKNTNSIEINHCSIIYHTSDNDLVKMDNNVIECNRIILM